MTHVKYVWKAEHYETSSAKELNFSEWRHFEGSVSEVALVEIVRIGHEPFVIVCKQQQEGSDERRLERMEVIICE